MDLLLLLVLTGQLLSTAASSSSSSSNDYYKHHHRCDWCPRHSTASLFPPKDKEEVSSDRTDDMLDGFHRAAATADLFGCGASCYQLRCRDRRLCGDAGVNVAVTEKANGTGRFLLTRDAFAAMASRNGMSSDQLIAGPLHNLQVDFRRIPCQYKKNLAVRVEDEGSRKPGHLAVRFLYLGGLTDVAAVEIARQLAQGDSMFSTPSCSSWRSMARRRKKQSVWHTTRAPAAGPLQLRLVVTAGSGGKWLRTALPADWRPGGVYDTGLQVTDVAVRACSRSCARRRRRAQSDDQ